MSKSYEEISKANASSNGKTDANLANDALHLGGIAAEEYATKKYVQDYHNSKEDTLKKYIDEQDKNNLDTAKEYANSLVRNQDFSSFAKNTDIQTLKEELSDDLEECSDNCTKKIEAVIKDVNDNFDDVSTSITALNKSQQELFQSVSNGKKKIAEAITDKGVQTSATDTFDTMASNVKKINTGLVIVPEGYMDTSDATATADKILQGYTAYANGNKIHGTLIPSGGISTGGVILGNDEVVVTKIYGEAGVLTGGEVGIATNISISVGANTSSRVAFIHTSVFGNYVIAERKRTENINNEIVIYNLSSTRQLHHNDSTAKFSYSFEELGIEGTIKCIIASPLEYWTNIVQVSVGTTTAIYNFLFDAKGNNGNGALGVTKPNGSSGGDIWKSKITINSPCNDYNSICYSNTDATTIAFYNYINYSGKITIKGLSWSKNSSFDTVNYTEVNVAVGNNVMALFRFNKSDRFLMYEAWGNLNSVKTGLMLLDDFVYVTSIILSESFGYSGWHQGQLLINGKDNFAIFNGKPYQVEYSLTQKSINLTKLSDSQVIPYSSGNNEYNFANFSSNDKYIYACNQQNRNLYGCYKVNLTNLESQWQNVSIEMVITSNADMPIIDVINDCVLAFDTTTGKFYFYYSDPSVKEIIGLSYNGERYKRTIGGF